MGGGMPQVRIAKKYGEHFRRVSRRDSGGEAAYRASRDVQSARLSGEIAAKASRIERSEIGELIKVTQPIDDID